MAYKKTHTDNIKDAHQHSMHAVLALTGMTPEDYCEYQYITGLQWLDETVDNDQYVAAQIAKSSTFWSWWRNMWVEREQSFTQYTILDVHIDFRTSIWRQFHNPRLLYAPGTEYGKIMAESFANLIGIIIKEK